MKNIKILFFLFCVILLSACIKGDAYQKEYFFKDKNWQYTDVCNYNVNISDTSCKYNLFLLLKHTYKYPHSNIWVQLLNTNPKGRTDTLRIEVPLALPTTGEWLGRRMHKIVEHKLNIGPNGSALKFSLPGIYKLQILQDMRINPLPEVISSGLALEKEIATKK